MLKYRINTNIQSENVTEVPLLRREISDIGDDDRFVSVACYYEGDLNIRKDSVIYLREYYNAQPFSEMGEDIKLLELKPEIIEANAEYRYFVFNMDKYFNLTISGIEAFVEDNLVRLRFVFETPHYFRETDDEIGFYVDFYDSEGNMYEKYFDGCEIEDEYSLLWAYDSTSSFIDLFMCTVFNKDTYTFLGYEGNENSVLVDEIPTFACFTDELYLKKKVTSDCDDTYEYYEKECNNGDISSLISFRIQFLTDYDVYMETGDIQITLPLSQMHDTSLLNEDIVMNKYVQDEILLSTNTSPEMEKYAYHPVFLKKTNNFETEDIYKIKFNLHFRQHRGEDWKAEDNTFWNGVDNETKELEKRVDAAYGNKFFSYYDKSKQSDLLAYLGFTNNDVKFQKNKLKKSFLRLMWYDSDVPTRQNLLYYANVYLDGGKLFLKYMNNASTEGYVLPSMKKKVVFTGAKVNMEYAPDNLVNLKDDEIEEHRLSSQVSITNIYDSESSSEGYNLYLWADSEKREMSDDIYLKIEFNHAGYGRTIPFFMPYFDYKKEGKYGIKTFEEIMYDWRVGNGYGIRKFNKYSYIHFKCRYDKENDRRVYYLDPETYGDWAFYGNKTNDDSSPNELEINIYEGKVTFLNENDE